jgi:hypothetical protein
VATCESLPGLVEGLEALAENKWTLEVNLSDDFLSYVVKRTPDLPSLLLPVREGQAFNRISFAVRWRGQWRRSGNKAPPMQHTNIFLIDTGIARRLFCGVAQRS